MNKFFALALTLLMASGCVQSEQFVRSGSIALGDITASSDISNIAISPEGTLACVVGSYVKERDAVSYSTVTMLDLVQKKASWTRQIAPPEATANIYAIACRFHGKDMYVLANADSTRAMANNQSRVYLYKYAGSGEEIKHVAVPVATESRIAIDLLVHNGGLHVIGYGKDEDTTNEYYSMFISAVDETLAFQTRMMKDGGYTQFSAARSIGGTIYIGGDFFPKTVAKTDLPIYYANSKIKSNGGYLWSVRPKHKVVSASENIATAIDDKATTFSLSQSKATSSVIAVDASGKIRPAIVYKSTLCKVDLLTPAGNGLLAIRQVCGSGSKHGLVWIDPVAGTETALDLLGNTPKFIISDHANWYGVNANGRGLEFVFGKLEGK
jgi:hypothetical protein